MTEDERDATLKALSVELADKGKLMEAGFVVMRLAFIRADAPEAQVREMRVAFMAGAQHLFASIMVVLEAGEEPTTEDLKRIGLIDAELRAFEGELRAWARPRP